MGQSTNGQICFGIMFEEGFEFPWDGDDEGWWRRVNGYKPPFELYDSAGNYIDGKKPPEAKAGEYFAHQRRWDEEHPIPIKVVNYSSGDCPAYILAVPSSVKAARRGYPELFDPAALAVSEQEVESLMNFIRRHVPSADADGNRPAWFLSSYWG